ncbi:MAG: hypothetical protein LCH38_08435 [Proteobacteria bacterium]|nr:hypothetical protein [Pseudomonadota bacterium]
MTGKPDGDEMNPSAIAPESAASAGTRASRRAKPAAIDLPAHTVEEISTQSEPAPAEPAAPDSTPESPSNHIPENPATPPASAPPAESSPSGSLKPVLVALAAGLIGGAIANPIGGYLWPTASPPDPALLQRLEKLEKSPATPASPALSLEKIPGLEAALAELRGREKPLREEIARLGTALTAEREARAKVIAALPAGTSGDSVSAMDALRKEISALATRLEASEKAPRMTGADPLARAQAGLAALSLIESALATGNAYAAPTDLLGRLGYDAGAVEALAFFAKDGVPSLEKLVQEYRAAPVLATRPEQVPDSTGILERLKAGAASLVQIRKTGDAAPADDTTRLARGEAALRRGDLAGTIALIDQFTPPLAADFRPLRVRLAAIVKARAAVGTLRAETVAQLSKALTP